jgi:hypothetical protein
MTEIAGNAKKAGINNDFIDITPGAKMPWDD